LGQRRSPGGKGREAEFPAQAQVVAWARGSAGARGWAGRAGERGWAVGSWAECAGTRAREQAMGRFRWAAQTDCWIGPKWPNK